MSDRWWALIYLDRPHFHDWREYDTSDWVYNSHRDMQCDYDVMLWQNRVLIWWDPSKNVAILLYQRIWSYIERLHWYLWEIFWCLNSFRWEFHWWEREDQQHEENTSALVGEKLEWIHEGKFSNFDTEDRFTKFSRDTWWKWWTTE